MIQKRRVNFHRLMLVAFSGTSVARLLSRTTSSDGLRPHDRVVWLHASSQGHESVLGMRCHSLAASVCGGFARHFSASSGLFQAAVNELYLPQTGPFFLDTGSKTFILSLSLEFSEDVVMAFIQEVLQNNRELLILCTRSSMSISTFCERPVE